MTSHPLYLGRDALATRPPVSRVGAAPRAALAASSVFPTASRSAASLPRGRDGCPQPSVRGQTHAPPPTFYPLNAQRRVRDNPPYPRQLMCARSSSPCPRVPSKAPPSKVGTAVLSRPFADGDAHLNQPPILCRCLSVFPTASTSRLSRPYLETAAINNEQRTKNTPSAASLPRGRDGCPQPSVRRLYSILDTLALSLNAQRRVGDNPPYLDCPPALVSSFTPHVPVPACPLAQARAPASNPHLSQFRLEVLNRFGVRPRLLLQILQYGLKIVSRFFEISRSHGDIAGEHRTAVGPR